MIAQMEILLEQEHLFRTFQEAIDFVENYKKLLSAKAQEQRQQGYELKDQFGAIELFALRPNPSTLTLSPLALLGGMGPLAGAEGFIKACQNFLDSREIVLLQACSVPDRSRVIIASQEKTKESLKEHNLLVQLLEASIKELLYKVCRANVVDRIEKIDRLKDRKEKPKLIVLCNTAHYFLPEVVTQLNSRDCYKDFELVSLVETVVLFIKKQAFTRVLPLTTVGAKRCKLYSKRFKDEGISYIELSDRAEALLMKAIFQGVKAFNQEESISSGEQFFLEILATKPNIDCLVAGCTEIPHLIKLLEEKANKKVRDFISSVSIIDPVKIAFDYCYGG